MKVHYNLEKLQRILRDLSTLTGISLSVLDVQWQPLIHCVQDNDFCETIQARDGCEKCRCSDSALLNKCRKSRAPESHICHAGLCDLAMPVLKKNMIVGYLVMGRIRSPQSPEAPESPELAALYEQIPCFTAEKLASLIDLLPQILFESAVELEPDDFIRQAADYIEFHLQEELSIPFLCEALHVSKNRLYDAFRTHYGCTVNAYLTARRMEKARLLLRETDEPVYRVAELVGIRNYTYFCRLFREKAGISPLAYRRNGTG